MVRSPSCQGKKNQSAVKTADVHFDGGTLHVVESILSLPTNVTDTTAALNMPIATRILSMPGFQNSVDGALSDVTVFIPSDNAAGPSSGNAPPFSSQDFNNILGYHMVVGTVLYSSEVKNEELPTYTNNNEKVTIRKIGNDIYVNQAKILERDILINAGVAHVIDSVPMPGNSSLPSSVTSANASASQTTPSSSTIASSSATATPSQSSSSSTSHSASTLSPGAYGGIGVGAAVGASAIVVLIVLLCLRKHRKHKQDSDPVHDSVTSDQPIRWTRDARELPSTRMDSPARQELASDREKSESARRAELDSKTIMAQIPQDIYLTRAELGAEHLMHPAYGGHTSVNDHPLKRG